MREIGLSMGLAALVDDDMFEYLNQWKWSATKRKNTIYAIRAYDNARMHRVVLGVTDPQIKCDHRDLNGLNNQKNNLRIATDSQNNSNRRSRKNSTSKYLGVCWNKRDKKWVAQIQSGGAVTYLGAYTNEVEAAVAYNNMAAKIHGDFANLNQL